MDLVLEYAMQSGRPIYVTPLRFDDEMVCEFVHWHASESVAGGTLPRFSLAVLATLVWVFAADAVATECIKAPESPESHYT